ncbi:hypothetical protein SeMB42_g01853 [Synchytrium endobioticum]|uniref:Pentacotripeptide-repeat region of PRORP domain-containing protein n=1 Tax=Synchytrium endobioticum TaxID=286115 RepID=A0A507D5T4_9FUNG|nr:hypothetical protein SeLEV6574_g03071 [Synchytrium endobioticum]TPX51551.1 hypothetical protein SeMB42_g01853 [Synchytrium endobioticum]
MNANWARCLVLSRNVDSIHTATTSLETVLAHMHDTDDAYAAMVEALLKAYELQNRIPDIVKLLESQSNYIAVAAAMTSLCQLNQTLEPYIPIFINMLNRTTTQDPNMKLIESAIISIFKQKTLQPIEEVTEFHNHFIPNLRASSLPPKALKDMSHHVDVAYLKYLTSYITQATFNQRDWPTVSKHVTKATNHARRVIGAMREREGVGGVVLERNAAHTALALYGLEYQILARPRGDSYTTFIDEFNHMRMNAFKPNTNSISILLKYLCRPADMQPWWQTCQRPSPSTQNIMSVNQVKSLVQSMGFNLDNPVFYSHLFHTCLSLDPSKTRAYALDTSSLRKLEEEHLQNKKVHPDLSFTNFCHDLIMVCFLASKPQLALAKLADARASGYYPSLSQYNQYLYLLSSASHDMCVFSIHDFWYSIRRDIIHKHTALDRKVLPHIYQSLLKSCSKAGDLVEMMRVAQEMRSLNVVPTEKAAQLIADFISRHPSEDQVSLKQALLPSNVGLAVNNAHTV